MLRTIKTVYPTILLLLLSAIITLQIIPTKQTAPIVLGLLATLIFSYVTYKECKTFNKKESTPL